MVSQSKEELRLIGVEVRSEPRQALQIKELELEELIRSPWIPPTGAASGPRGASLGACPMGDRTDGRSRRGPWKGQGGLRPKPATRLRNGLAQSARLATILVFRSRSSGGRSPQNTGDLGGAGHRSDRRLVGAEMSWRCPRRRWIRTSNKNHNYSSRAMDSPSETSDSASMRLSRPKFLGVIGAFAGDEEASRRVFQTSVETSDEDRVVQIGCRSSPRYQLRLLYDQARFREAERVAQLSPDKSQRRRTSTPRSHWKYAV